MSGVIRAVDAQFGNPHGRLGRIVAAGLNVANRPLNRATIETLELTQGERVLDVGFGGGVGIAMALRAGADVVAIDPSGDMVDAARKRFGERAVIHTGSAAEPGEPPASLDAAYAVNTVYFWPDVPAGLAGLHDVLRPGGRLAIGVELTLLARRARSRATLPASPSALAELLGTSGFDGVTTLEDGRRRAVVCGVRA